MKPTFTIPLTNAAPAALSYNSPALPGLGMPTLQDFTSAVINGNADQVVGVYASDALALPARQQPSDQPNFVSPRPDEVTQFAMASRFNTIGLLAHNYLAGETFYSLQESQTIILIYGDGAQKLFQIEAIQRYQALTPNSPQSNFLDLNGSGELLTAADLFNRVYSLGDRLVLQTCINAEGDPSWGRLFVIATPLESIPISRSIPLRQRILAWL